MVTHGNFVENPDLSKVDEIGFADLMPGSGHGPGGWTDVARSKFTASRSENSARIAPSYLECAEQRLLPAQSIGAIVGKTLDPSENRLLVEVRFGDHLRLQAAGEPLIVPIGRERILRRSAGRRRAAATRGACR